MKRKLRINQSKGQNKRKTKKHRKKTKKHRNDVHFDKLPEQFKTRATFRKKPIPLNEKMNCSPAVKGKTILDDTCYTANILAKIKTAYNASHSNDQIVATLPNDIISELRARMKHCKKEDCWLEEIKDSEMRRQIDELIFAPDHPKEWKKNPNEWLSNYDIAAVLRQYEVSHPNFKLLGPSSIDYDTKINKKGKCVWDDLCRLSLQDLIDHNKNKLGIVFNLDKHDEPGSHWVSIFVDLDNSIIFYYDSALNPIPKEIHRLKNEIIKQGKSLSKPILFKFINNKHQHQKSNTECGMYSLFFIITFLTSSIDQNSDDNNSIELNENLKQLSIKSKIELFTNKRIPDEYVSKYRTIYFNST